MTPYSSLWIEVTLKNVEIYENLDSKNICRQKVEKGKEGSGITERRQRKTAPSEGSGEGRGEKSKR